MSAVVARIRGAIRPLWRGAPIRFGDRRGRRFRGAMAPWAAGAHALAAHWLRHPLQAATLVLGLALATALWTGVQAINAEARASYDRAAGVVTQNNAPVLVAADGAPIPVAAYVRLRRAGWPVAPILEGRARLGDRSMTLIGLDPLSSPVLPGAEADDGGAAGLAAFVGPPGQLFAEAGTAAALHGALAQEIVVSPDVAPDTVIGDIATIARLLNRPDTLSRLALVADPPASAPSLAEIAPGMIRTAPTAEAEIGGLTGSFHLNLTAFGFLSFTVGLFIVHGAIGLAFEQRRGVFRTLRALGLPARTLVALVAAELALAALLAGLLGVALGYLIAAALLPDVAATLRGLYGAPASGSLVLRPGWVAAGMGMAALGTLIAAAQALHRLLRLPILASAQPRAWRIASEAGLRWQAVLAGGLLVVAALTGIFGAGLVASFLMLGTLLLGAALMVPPVLGVALKAAGAQAKTALAQWFWADTRQQLPGLSLALMALMLALSANIGVSTMVGSFRATFTGWLDQRLASELYVDAGTDARAAEIAAWAGARDATVLPIVRADARLDGRPAQVFGMADHATYRDHWPLIDAAPDAWDGLARGEGLFVNEQFAYRVGVGPGDVVTLDGGEHAVLAVYSDYGNPMPQAILGLPWFDALYPGAPRNGFAMRLAGDEIAPVRAALMDRFGLPPDQVVDQAAIKAMSLEIFERTFAVTGALNVLTLGVAGVAIFTALATLAAQRLPQVAPVWALGLTRAEIGRLEVLRAGVLAALTCALALPVGLVLAWMLLAVINVEAFGWRLPLLLFPGDWALLAGLALVAALAAAALPAWRLAARPAADLLKVFASDR